MSVLCAGHINWDVTMFVDALPEPDGEVTINQLNSAGGGSAANVAVGLVGLDVAADLYGSVGGDDTGALALRELDRAGVDCGHVVIDSAATTSVKYLVVDSSGEVMVFANDGANESFAGAEVPTDLFSGVDQLHLTGQSPSTASLLATLATDMSIPVSFDPGRRVTERAYTDAVANSDLVFLNQREADGLAQSDMLSPTDPDDQIVVIKHGADGATVHTPTGETSHAGFHVEPVDLTGAGDAFAAGFLATLDGSDRLSTSDFDPDTYREALIVGNACGAIAATTATARTTLSWDAVAAVRDGTAPNQLSADDRSSETGGE